MHEVAIAQNIIEICQAHAGTSDVASVKLEIGDLSGVVADSIEFCFEACAKGTQIEGATLQIDRIKGSGKCSSCGAVFELSSIFSPCPTCQLFPVEVLSGKEMRVCEIQLKESQESENDF